MYLYFVGQYARSVWKGCPPSWWPKRVPFKSPDDTYVGNGKPDEEVSRGTMRLVIN